MKLIDVTCPECGAAFEVNAEMTECTCNYCGKKVLIDFSDEVLIEREKTKQLELKLKKEEQERIEDDKVRKFAFISAFISVIVCLILISIPFLKLFF